VINKTGINNTKRVAYDTTDFAVKIGDQGTIYTAQTRNDGDTDY